MKIKGFQLHRRYKNMVYVIPKEMLQSWFWGFLLTLYTASPVMAVADCSRHENPFEQVKKLGTFVNRVNARLLQPASKEIYCENAADLRTFQAILANDATDKDWDSQTRPGFRNGGEFLFGEGVCWWHSQLTRSAAYLAIVRPLNEGERPMTEQEVGRVIDDILANKKVVEIRGYENFGAFTKSHKHLVQEKLEKFATTDILAFGWTRLLEGSDELKASELQKLMDRTYEEVEIKGRVVYQKFKMKEPGTHAWLVTGVEKRFRDGEHIGYTLKYIDSNLPERTSSVEYDFGDTYIHRYGGFVPYTQRERNC